MRMTALCAILALSAAACVGSADEKAKPVGGDEKVKEVTVAEVRAPELEKFLKDQKGKVVLIDCWATWCAPCVKKFPHFVETHKKYADKGLVCVSLSLDKFTEDEFNRDKVLKFLKEKGA